MLFGCSYQMHILYLYWMKWNFHQTLSKLLYIQVSRRIPSQDNKTSLSTKSHITIYIHGVKFQNIVYMKGPNQAQIAFSVLRVQGEPNLSSNPADKPIDVTAMIANYQSMFFTCGKHVIQTMQTMYVQFRPCRFFKGGNTTTTPVANGCSSLSLVKFLRD